MSRPECITVTKQEVPARLLELVTLTIRSAIAERGVCHLALPGGSVAKELFPLLREAKLPWESVQVFWGDERAVPLSHEDSNYRLASELLLSHIAIPPDNVHPMHADVSTLEKDAHSYEQTVRAALGPTGAFDLVLLGVGEDGHVCSLFPGHALLREQARWVAEISDSPKPPKERITLTLPVLGSARRVIACATGAGKAEAVAQALVADATSPLGLVLQESESPERRPGSASRVTLLLDEAAGREMGA